VAQSVCRRRDAEFLQPGGCVVLRQQKRARLFVLGGCAPWWRPHQVAGPICAIVSASNHRAMGLAWEPDLNCSVLGRTLPPPWPSHWDALVVDDDLGTVETIAFALRCLGATVVKALSGLDAMRQMRHISVALAIVDLRLPDGSGVEVIASLNQGASPVPCILISAYLTIDVAVDAMKRGAVDVLEKPPDLDQLVVRIREHFGTVEFVHPNRLSAERQRQSDLPRTTAGRFVGLVLGASESQHDLKTLGLWAEHSGVSESSLCELCRILDIDPHGARDFARIMRVLLTTGRNGRTFGSCLDICDRRTLRSLLVRAGLSPDDLPRDIRVADYLRRQGFISEDHEVLNLLHQHLAKKAI
jgi:two-component system, response regulator RegA